MVTDSVTTLFQASLTLIGSIVILLLFDVQLALMTFLIFPVMAVGSLAFRLASADALPAHARDDRRDHRLPAGVAVGHPRRALVRAGAAPRARASRELNDDNRDGEHDDGQPQRRVLPGGRVRLAPSRRSGSCSTAATRCCSGDVTVGVLVGFIAALNGFFDPISQLSQVYTTYQSGMAALDKIFELLDEQPDLVDAPGAPRAAAAAARRDRVRGRRRSPTRRPRATKTRAGRRDAARPAGPDRRAGRRDRRRQVDVRQARGALLRPDRRARSWSTATTCAT